MRHKDHHDCKGRHEYITGSELTELRATAVRNAPVKKPPGLLKDLDNLGNGLTSDSTEGQYEAARQLRAMLSKERDAVVEEVGI